MERKQVVEKIIAQRGSITLVATLILMSVVAVMVLNSQRMAGTTAMDSSVSSKGNEALFLAESGVEYFNRVLSIGDKCSQLSAKYPSAFSVGNGEFKLVSANETVTKGCDMVIEGKQDGNSRFLQAIVERELQPIDAAFDNISSIDSFVEKGNPHLSCTEGKMSGMTALMAEDPNEGAVTWEDLDDAQGAVGTSGTWGVVVQYGGSYVAGLGSNSQKIPAVTDGAFIKTASGGSGGSMGGSSGGSMGGSSGGSMGGSSGGSMGGSSGGSMGGSSGGSMGGSMGGSSSGSMGGSMGGSSGGSMGGSMGGSSGGSMGGSSGGSMGGSSGGSMGGGSGGSMGGGSGGSMGGGSGGSMGGGMGGGSSVARWTGFRQGDLGRVLPPGTKVDISFNFRKWLATPSNNHLFAVDMVTTDATVYRVWCDSATTSGNWIAIKKQWSVPQGKELQKIRIVYDLSADGPGSSGGAHASLPPDSNALACSSPGVWGFVKTGGCMGGHGSSQNNRNFMLIDNLTIDSYAIGSMSTWREVSK